MSYQVAIMTAEGQCISEFELQQTHLGFQDLAQQLKPLGSIPVNIERLDGLLVDWLIEQGHAVFVTPPRIAARRRPRRSKDDWGDARWLALMGEHSQGLHNVLFRGLVLAVVQVDELYAKMRDSEKAA
jgi:hypothetical protein